MVMTSRRILEMWTVDIGLVVGGIIQVKKNGGCCDTVMFKGQEGVTSGINTRL